MRFLPAGIRGKIIVSYVAIFLLILPLLVAQSVTGIRQANEYRAILDNLGRASRLNTTIQTEIEPIVWDIVAGKIRFATSGLQGLMADIRRQMDGLRLDHYSRNNRTLMDVVLRTTSTLENYMDRLERQVAERRPVAENEATLEEIRGVVSLIADLMQNFMTKQMNEFSIINERIGERNNRNFIVGAPLFLMVVSIGFFTVWAISGSISRPIGELRRMASTIAQGDFHSRIALKEDGELSELADSMNSMAGQIELLLQKSIEEERSLKMSEMKSLQAQITPHFLYNTLDAIIWAAESNRSADVIKLVTALSSFFRITLSHGVDFIPLREEVRHVENYLIIQQMRYNDILEYTIDVDGAISDEAVLKFLLQPLVENAIYHGIRNMRERGRIVVSAGRHADGIAFRVSDTGIGMTGERLEQVRRRIKTGPNAESRRDETQRGAGFGLFNVNRRLELYYSPESGLLIESAPGAGTTVSFVLPKMPERGAERV
ncbi:MAG: sensor histidine kinase [Synergistaceae bacterium]|jgi:two-component system sensor histidine kinase YesM|nr:sensor histidine kinase [Synergistaceae bacterium]